MRYQEPSWLIEARKSTGLREIPGAPTAPVIQQWLARLGAWWRDDETPWCGVAVAAWMTNRDIEVPKHWYRAKAWLDWGINMWEPEVGAVVVIDREGGGHVGLVTGITPDGSLRVFGGNQGNRVCEAVFDPARVLGYRWPPKMPFPSIYGEPLPVAWANVSSGEA